jgi:hypothetical protein
MIIKKYEALLTTLNIRHDGDTMTYLSGEIFKFGPFLIVGEFIITNSKYGITDDRMTVTLGVYDTEDAAKKGLRQISKKHSGPLKLKLA